jgi:hypothetical protein
VTATGGTYFHRTDSFAQRFGTPPTAEAQSEKDFERDPEHEP